METLITFILGVGSALLLGLITYGVVAMLRVIKESKESTELVLELQTEIADFKMNKDMESDDLYKLLEQKEVDINVRFTDINKLIDSRFDKLEFKLTEDIQSVYDTLQKELETIKTNSQIMRESL